MTNYTLDNHLSYTTGNVPFGYRLSGIEKYSVSVGGIDDGIYRKSSYREELRRTADIVYKEFGKDLVVFLSGGTDSEMVIRNFLEIGIRPKCATIKFRDGYNDADVNEALKIANDLDLNLNIIDFDIKDFYFSGEANEFGKSVQCTQVTYLMVYKNILTLGAPSVMGGEVLLTRQVTPNDSYWYYTFRENEDASAMRFSQQYGIPLVNEWFSYTPELLLYYLEDPKIVSLVTQKDNFKLTSVSSKNDILRKLFPDVRKKVKTHGFERLLGFNFEAYRQLTTDQIKRLEPSLDGIRYDDIIRMLRNGNKTTN